MYVSFICRINVDWCAPPRGAHSFGVNPRVLPFLGGITILIPQRSYVKGSLRKMNTCKVMVYVNTYMYTSHGMCILKNKYVYIFYKMWYI